MENGKYRVTIKFVNGDMLVLQNINAIFTKPDNIRMIDTEGQYHTYPLHNFMWMISKKMIDEETDSDQMEIVSEVNA